MIPASSYGLLHTNTILVLLADKFPVYFLELLIVSFETIAGVSMFLGSVRWIFLFHSSKDSFFLFESQSFESECFDNSTPFLSNSHFDTLESRILIIFPL